MQCVSEMSALGLLEELLAMSAKRDAIDFDLIEESRYAKMLGERMSSLKAELSLRTGGGGDELVQKLVGLYVTTVNSGEDRSPKVRGELDRLTAQVIARTGQDSVPQPA